MKSPRSATATRASPTRHSTTGMPTQCWDIFCRAIDNYGDVGFCWRLAQQLAQKRLTVRLWADDLNKLHTLCPAIDANQIRQHQANVEILAWSDAPGAITVADVVVAAFSCHLPDHYLSAMVERHPSPLWINMEYLATETWQERYHKQPSPHPTLPLTRYFYFPGFSPACGGLLKRDVPETPAPEPTHSLRVSLFCYPEAPVIALFQAWQTASRPIHCLLLGDISLPETSWVSGNLTIEKLPMLPQAEYDRLLHQCDYNFVRGEDSLVSAVFAGRPLIWQPYRQAEQEHLNKLTGFLDNYCSGLAHPAAMALRQIHLAWNQQWAIPWQALEHHQSELNAQAQAIQQHLLHQDDLVSQLVAFCENLV